MRIVLVLLLASTAHAGEVVRLSKDNWSRAPKGKEADAIYGDWLLANDRVLVVIADPVQGRNASDSVKDAGGAIIDFTLKDAQNDQLSGFIPGLRAYRKIEVIQESGPAKPARAAARGSTAPRRASANSPNASAPWLAMSCSGPDQESVARLHRLR